MNDCLFCKIGNKEIPAKLVHEDAEIFAFEDIQPQAPVHILIVPNRHIVSCAELAAGDEAVMGHLMVKAAYIAAQANVAGGFRLVSNVGRPAGQSVLHLHVHLLGGRTFRWPPG